MMGGMAKLLLVVLHKLDAENVVTALEEAGHRLTQIPSIGGFLGIENVTLMMAVEEEKADDVVAVIERCLLQPRDRAAVVRPGPPADELPSLVRHGRDDPRRQLATRSDASWMPLLIRRFPRATGGVDALPEEEISARASARPRRGRS